MILLAQCLKADRKVVLRTEEKTIKTGEDPLNERKVLYKEFRPEERHEQNHRSRTYFRAGTSSLLHRGTPPPRPADRSTFGLSSPSRPPRRRAAGRRCPRDALSCRRDALGPANGLAAASSHLPLRCTCSRLRSRLPGECRAHIRARCDLNLDPGSAQGRRRATP